MSQCRDKATFPGQAAKMSKKVGVYCNMGIDFEARTFPTRGFGVFCYWGAVNYRLAPTWRLCIIAPVPFILQKPSP